MMSNDELMHYGVLGMKWGVRKGDYAKAYGKATAKRKKLDDRVVKAKTAYEKAMANNEGQYQALDAFLETASESITAFDGIDSNISDDEIDELITSGAVDCEDDIDQEIDKKIIQESKPKGLEDVAYEAARCDYLPPEYITFLITDLGVLAPSSVSDELIKLYS